MIECTKKCEKCIFYTFGNYKGQRLDKTWEFIIYRKKI